MVQAVNRFTDWYMVWSPDDKELIDSEHKEYFIKILKKNTIKFSISYEVGESGTNPHLDMVAVFKNKQTKNDVLKKINRTYIHYWDLAKSGPLVINHISDWKYRLGYNLKEGEQICRENLTEEEQQIAIDHYDNLNIERAKEREIKQKYKYIGQKNVINTIHKYKVKNDLKVKEPDHLAKIISTMMMDGYYFDIKSDTKRKIFKFILANELQDKDYIQADLDEWLLEPEQWQAQHDGQYLGNYNIQPFLP